MKYYISTILKCGELAKEFFDENVMVFFGKQAPDELQEYSIVHEHSQSPTEELRPGDTIIINRVRLKVLAVGSVANDNLKNLGHLVIKFNDSEEVEMEGDINVQRRTLPNPKVRSKIILKR